MAHAIRMRLTMLNPPRPARLFAPVNAPVLWAVLLVCAAVVAACETPPAPKPTTSECGGTTGIKCPGGPVATPAPPPVPTPPPPAPPPDPLTDAEVRQALDNVRAQLDQGKEEAAAAELQRVLVSHPQNKVALSLQRQMREDPQQLYGRESFAYRVLSGDTLATIAQRQMNDRDQFYGLARYNGITEPRRLEVGRVIRIPGRAPVPAPSVPSPPAPPAPAPAPVPPPPPPPQTPPPPPPPVRTPAAEIERWMKLGYARKAQQDLCGAANAFSEVLKLDAAHTKAGLERESALGLVGKLGKKC